ncbi:hypothetical protein FHY55_09575 [Oceanicola sp. D3]|uniref:hypothetical protein n=1 Tax=Oceanicola sp. D3 TaxID=2587163 RepID=UPI001120EEAD|nr:hypothetical protein [Oceanicola sp. D3]QDC09480.1 hypothetical protein FHY55_09575 [Oceanicola sp. D3]
MFLRHTLSATVLTLLLTAPLAAETAPATLPEGFADIAAKHGLAFNPAAGTLSPGGTITAYELALEGGTHTLRFGDCDEAGCASITITSILPNIANLDGRAFGAEMSTGRYSAFSAPPLHHRITVRADSLRIETTFKSSEPDALEEAIGRWRHGILQLTELLATPRPDPSKSLSAVFSPEALTETLAALDATMKPDTEGGARLPETEKSFLVTGKDFSYLATFTGCRAEGCTGLTLQAVVENPGRLTGPEFNAIYDDGQFAFISDTELPYNVRANLRVVTINTDVWPEMAEDPERLKANLATFHRYITELSTALAEAPPAPDPLEQTVRKPEDVAQLIRALGSDAAAVKSGGHHVIRVPGRGGLILIYYQGCKNEKDPAGCRFLLLTSSRRLLEKPADEAIARYTARSFCCKAVWSEEDKRLTQIMSLPLRPGIDAALMDEALVIFRSQLKLFERDFPKAQ